MIGKIEFGPVVNSNFCDYHDLTHQGEACPKCRTRAIAADFMAAMNNGDTDALEVLIEALESVR